MPAGIPGLRLASFYFVFFASVGVFMPYWTLYLEELGFPDTTIGTLMALLMATRIVAPHFWAAASDRSGRRMGVARLGAVAATMVFAVAPALHTPLALGAVLVVYSIFWSAVLPQFEAVTLTWLGEARRRYSRLRLWGSVGFVVTSTSVGLVLERFGIPLLPWLIAVTMASVAATTLLIPEPPRAPRPPAGSAIWATLRRPPVLALLLGCALMQASHGPYYVFFSIHLEDQGFTRGTIGALWSFSVVAEVLMFAALPWILGRIAPTTVFTWCFLLTGLRWLLLAFGPADLTVLVPVQALHAASFGAYHAVAIQFVHEHFTGRQQARGQALYSALSFGAGGAAGSVASGWLWSQFGSAVTFSIAAAVAAVGAAVVHAGLARGVRD
jgi:PPP family 3-phenylpropionic acid transporter